LGLHPDWRLSEVARAARKEIQREHGLSDDELRVFLDTEFSRVELGEVEARGDETFATLGGGETIPSGRDSASPISWNDPVTP
jgi:hypothetical protein